MLGAELPSAEIGQGGQFYLPNFVDFDGNVQRGKSSKKGGGSVAPITTCGKVPVKETMERVTTLRNKSK